jgi:hypothetical protein
MLSIPVFLATIPNPFRHARFSQTIIHCALRKALKEKLPDCSTDQKNRLPQFPGGKL